MRSSRLTLALETGAVVLPGDGPLAIFRPHIGDDLSMFPQDRVRVVQGFKPDHDHFAAQGYAVAVAGAGPYAAAMVCLPRAKAEARALLAAAAAQVAPGGPVIVDGQKTDGVDAVYKELRALRPVSEALSKAHGRLFTFAAGPDVSGPGLEDWAAQPTTIDGGFQTLPGVFSADGPDRGSVLLAQALPDRIPGHVVDLGAGWGYLSRAVLARSGVKKLDLVEAEAAALECARLNITDERARFHWADAMQFHPARAVDAVVCNPPFHAAREADPAIGMGFVQAAARMLQPGGTLWLVANRHLPYAATLTTLFTEVEEIGGDSAFRVIRAARPQRARR
ncbi:class I SAM-dependent methyltransferase [Fertoebacter nigrum]|uniref:Class I SAM-dependent methyltransferase n=1 Tax=Fertoeibacter niger TaxID=2656921 RepID=A0A8X8KR19_9RHOB|nr:methyltransferase [Fertoeibacter niger]NUB44707.1 class I SAM-dependent methyltransferase [Fertoeibacter niger]